MKIDSPAENRIIVELSRRDMQELDITYEKIDYSEKETRRVIRFILDAAEKALGKKLNISGKTVIEVIPEAGGGCILSFTMLEKSSERPFCSFENTQNRFIVFEFCSAEELLNFIEILPEKISFSESMLYEQNNCYRLAAALSGNSPDITAGLNELCDNVLHGKYEYEMTKEHWNILTVSPAVEKIKDSLRRHHGDL